MNAASGSGEPTPGVWSKGAIVTHNGGGSGKSADPRALARAFEPYRTDGNADAAGSPGPDEEQMGGR